MEWKDYIKSIKSSGIADGSLETITIKLFDIAGCVVSPSSEAVKSWIYSKRNCKSSTYFPKGHIKIEAVFRYFRNRPSDTLFHLQKIFENQILPNSGSPIDVKTTDLDILCWSLVNQFLDLLRFERVDISQPKDGTTNVEQVPSPYDRKCCAYCTHWSGDRSVIGISRIPTYGTCRTHRGNKHYFIHFLSSTAACPKYKADENLMNRMKEHGYDVKDFI